MNVMRMMIDTFGMKDEMTDVEHIIQTVSNDVRIPVYYRRRLSDYAREDARKWNRYINQTNNHQKRMAEDDDDLLPVAITCMCVSRKLVGTCVVCL